MLDNFEKITSYEKVNVEIISTGTQIKRLREKLGMTQEEFGDVLWVNKCCVARWESDDRKCKGPSLRLINVLCEYSLWNKL